MEGINDLPYRLSDRFLLDYLEQQPEEILKTLLPDLNILRHELSEPLSGETKDINAVVEPLQLIQKHQSWIGLSTGPTIWSLANYYAKKSQIPRPIQVLLDQYEFYLIRFGVHLIPKKSERFVAVLFHAKYAEDSCFTYDQLPSTKLEPVVSGHANIDFGLKSDLSFGAKLPELPIGHALVVEAKAKAEAATDVKLVLKLDFDWRVEKVVSVGPDRPEALWRIHKKDLVGFVPLYAVIRTPKSMTDLICTICAQYTIDMPGWFRGKVEYQTDRIPLNLKLAGVIQA